MGQNKHKSVAVQHSPLISKPILTQVLLAVVFSIFTALCIPPLIKEVALFSGIVTLLCVLRYRKALCERLSLIGVVLLLLTAMTGLSVFYSPDRQLSFPEFCNLFIGFCLFVLFLIFAGGSAEKRRSGMTVIALSTAVTSLISIDLLSTRILYGIFHTITDIFTSNYSNVGGIEPGVRMTSLYSASNVFAGLVGIGVLLSLALSATAEKKEDSILSLVALYLNALAFVLTFSMGAIASIAVAFVAMLFLVQKERRIPLLVLMVETLVLTLLATVPIFATSFVKWTTIQPIPLSCAILGSLLLCVLHLRVGAPLSQKLSQYTKAATAAVGGVILLALIFAVTAYNWTGATTLSGGETLRRSAYPTGGDYSLTLETDSPLTVVIESQNEEDTLNHTSTILYSGDANSACFSVPDDSLVVYFNFKAADTTNFQSASINGDNGSIDLKLGYKLLPGFMANRLQGLWANENAIQRTAFFADGLKIFQTNPIIGRGVGSFESLFHDVQEYDYGTRYVHNHYIQLMLETGLIGLVLFLGAMALSLMALVRLRKQDEHTTMASALLACLAYMAIHASVEVVFSMGTYLAIALPTFAMSVLFAGDFVVIPTAPAGGKLPQLVVAFTAVILSAWVILIGLNRTMPMLVTSSGQSRYLDTLSLAATLDPFDRDDYIFSYIAIATQYGDATMIPQATEYAHSFDSVTDVSKLKTLAEFYLSIGDSDRTLETLTNFVSYDANDVEGWEIAFNIISTAPATMDTETYNNLVSSFYQLFLDHNASPGNEALTLSETTLFNIQTVIG